MLHDTARWWLLPILVAAVVLRLTLALVLPYDAGPDERRRFAFTERLYATGHALRYGSEGGPAYAVKPVFAYRINAWVARLVPGSLPLYVKLRFGSVLAGALVVGLAYVIARQLNPWQPALAAALSAVLAFHPQFMFISAYVNPDVYTVLANTVLLLVLSLAHRQGRLHAPLGVALGVALGLVFLGRENGYVGFILAGAYATWLLYRQFQASLRPLALATLVSLLFPVSFYLHQSSRYGTVYIPLLPDSGVSWVPPGWSVQQAYARLPLEGFDYPVFHLDWRQPAEWFVLITTLLFSSFGVFGYMDVGLPWFWYSWYLAVVVGGVVGLWRWLRCRWAQPDRRLTSRQALLASMALACAAIFFIVVRHNFVVLYQAQGRYLFPALVPLLLLLLLGWRQVARSREIGQALAASGVGFFVLGGSYSVWLLVRLYG